ncbi:protein LAZY 1-like isoform X2 [Mangifera indica]|uniref:protein LAZY 1-like isoform X2 n=1 Tax=Mangifera indica TaxID=29780 RepID=UPI001CF9CD42|nr:protein LAZY 1-like isoform X2 [Mangifera indica]
MKLLGWMHRKFRQNSSEPLKDFALGQPSPDDQQCYPKPNYGTMTKPFRQLGPREHQLRSSFAGLEAARVEEEDYEDQETSAVLSELFHGFLAIGTLGSEPGVNHPSTPTFGISVENITEKETEVTENELKLINDELEKVLGAEANKEDGCYESSGRNSHVSNGRSSHGSTITLSGKPLEGQDNNGNGFSVCPLQGYLFGSAIELSETTTVAKKEHRTSLGELFQRTKLAEENTNSGSKYEREEKRTDKEADKSAVQLMKKLLKKKMLHASRSSTGGGVDSASAETKLHKILHMFHRKVHPESSTATKKTDKPLKKVNRSMEYDRVDNGGQMVTDEDITIFPQRNLLKEKIRRYKSQSISPQITLGGCDSNGNREYWIKTDADYLVLEL